MFVESFVTTNNFIFVLFLFSLVPVAGLFPGIIYYRLCLVSSLRCYVPRTQNLALRWALRAIFVALLCAQFLPILGAFFLPVVCLIDYSLSRRALASQTIAAKAADTHSANALPAA